MSTAEVTLPSAVSSVPTARHFVESILSGWGLSDLGWPATMVVSELATNAVLHARGGQFRIVVSTGDAGVRLEVSDDSTRLPQQRSYSLQSSTGRGLRLVSELSDEWGVAPSEHGKTIWAVIRQAQEDGSSDEDVDLDMLLDAFDDDVVPIGDADERALSRSVA